MIYRLQRKFILISAVSIFTVIFLILVLMLAFNVFSMNQTLDTLADEVANGDGRFPDFGGMEPALGKPKPEKEPHFDYITPETPFSTRHFSVWLDPNGEVVKTNTESIAAITKETAIEYAKDVISDGNERGWLGNYRYKIFSESNGKTVVFIDGTINRVALLQSIAGAALALFGCAALVLISIILLSKRIVKPIAESYEKQKQFVTDANHELKTPLTLILANLDIAEAELGQNEWLDDIRTEGHRMTELVNRLVALSRLDEESEKPLFVSVPIGEIVMDTVSDFRGLVQERDKRLTADIDVSITCTGDEEQIRHLISILFDNALKYCDAGGEITVTLKRKRGITLTVENTYADVNGIELPRLFDRFYRADKARTFVGGYGIGLSMAKAIVEKHRGEITAYKKDGKHIGFRVIFKN